MAGIRAVWCLAIFGIAVPGFSQETTKLTVNDVSFLWPAPKAPDDASKLISVDEKLLAGDAIWPQDAFEKISALVTAPEQQVSDSLNESFGIRFATGTQSLSNWKIAGLRVDPSAPNCDPAVIAKVGSIPQVRLIVQPVVVNGDKLQVHDYAAHLVFDFVKTDFAILPDGTIQRAVPDSEAFQALIDDLVAIKNRLKNAGIETDVPLGVHPGFAKPDAGLADSLRALLGKHLRNVQLKHVGFMGIRPNEPWFFVAIQRSGDTFVAAPQRVLKGKTTQMFNARDPARVLPLPQNATFGAFGVSTAALLRRDADEKLDSDACESVPPLGRSPKLREVADIIANPRLSHLLNTDCVSCHSESTTRHELGLTPASAPFRYQVPPGVRTVDPALLPTDVWNVRNFGWGVVIRDVTPTITMRAANEAAESVALINQLYVVPKEPKMKAVSRPLNLVVTAKSPEDLEKLKALVARLQNGPDGRNLFKDAMDKVGNVHDARFVFLPGDNLGVFTTYDDEFDRYLDLFVDEAGEIFNLLLAHVKDAPTARVQDDREAFRAFVKAHDLSSEGSFYSAYPDLRVQDIKAATRNPAQP